MKSFALLYIASIILLFLLVWQVKHYKEAEGFRGGGRGGGHGHGGHGHGHGGGYGGSGYARYSKYDGGSERHAGSHIGNRGGGERHYNRVGNYGGSSGSGWWPWFVSWWPLYYYCYTNDVGAIVCE